MLTDAEWNNQWNELKYMIPEESKSGSDKKPLLVQRRKIWVNNLGNEIKIKKKNPLQCEICFKVFSWTHTLKRHQLQCGNDGDGPLMCDLCDKSFFRSDKLKNHIDKIHRRKIIKKEFSPKKNQTPSRFPRQCKNKRKFNRRTA